MPTVTMTCMTTKKKFDVDDPEVVVLKNNRYAYRVKCPWQGKNDRDLYAFKFCSAQAYEDYNGKDGASAAPESEQTKLS